MKDWELVVAGDKKTPADYRLERGIYITPEEQEKYDPVLSEAIGWNSIQRRNFAFLWAKDMKADIVALVDDDNIPLKGWGENLLLGRESKWTITKQICQPLTRLARPITRTSGIVAFRCSLCLSGIIHAKYAEKCGWIFKPIFGMEMGTLMPFAA